MANTNELEKINSVTQQMRLDLSATFEEEHKTPVYFKTKELLFRFVSECRFKAEIIRDLSDTEALYIVGGADSAYPYGLVWVAANLEQIKVRKALVNTIVDAYHLDESDLSVVHADHLFNRASVKDIPDAWLLLFPTVADVNWKSGFKLEKGLRVDPKVDEVELTPLHVFKMLSNFWPRNREEFEEGMKIISGQNLIPGMEERIRQYVGPTFHFPEIE